MHFDDFALSDANAGRSQMTDWTVEKPRDEWIPIEWESYHNPKVRPKFSNYWQAEGEARLLTEAGVAPMDYYEKPEQWGQYEARLRKLYRELHDIRRQHEEKKRIKGESNN
jgi:hypothetical protein